MTHFKGNGATAITNPIIVLNTIIKLGTHIPLVMEGEKQLRNRRREKIVALAGKREEI